MLGGSMHGKDESSVCGNYMDIVAKVVSDPNILYCKDSRDGKFNVLRGILI
ncbi:MAG TPA: hypothetical protein VIP56_05170 [Nitrososphaeraceae archaeon]